MNNTVNQSLDGFHKLIIMGISASVGLTMFLFNLEWSVITNLQTDVSFVREDVAYIKGIIESWSETYPNP